MNAKHNNQMLSSERLAVVRWAARLGAVTAEALAEREACSTASARARLQAAQRAQLIASSSPLRGQPALYTVTRAGMRAAGIQGLEPCRVSAAGAAHAIACARVAAMLERAYPDHRLVGERELRMQERLRGMPLASASLGVGAHDVPLLHRPDLVLWPAAGPSCSPLAVEVELTVKAPRRLFEICRAWARCRCVAGVLYLAAPDVLGPLERAIEKAHAQDRVLVLDLEAVIASLAGTVPSDA